MPRLVDHRDQRTPVHVPVAVAVLLTHWAGHFHCFCAAADDSKGIPGFWATVLARAELVLSEKDADALTYLTGWQLGGFYCTADDVGEVICV